MAKLLEQLVVPIADLRPYPGNPRRGNLEAIQESLRLNGQYRPIVVNRLRMEILAGNHTFLAAKELGWPEILATLLDVSDEEARRIVLVDNRTNDLAGYDEEGLLELLESVDELEGTGYDQAALDDLLEEVRGCLPLEEDEVLPLPPEPRSKPGDLYELGGHGLLCGDARDPACYRRLLEGEPAQLLWTDPPYGVAYEGKTAASLRIENDEPAGLEALLGQSFAAIDGALAEGAPLYVAHPAGARCHAFICAFLTQGWQLRQTLVWVKDALVLGHGDYHYRHEPLLYGYKPAAGRLGRGGAGWFGGNGECSVLEVERPRASREHPTMKPPQLIELCLRNSSRRGTLVLDPFAGSGSTLVACERSGRRARLVELDPRYCDVVVERFERLTGERARLL
jgi:DNA modification methylase